MTCCGMKEGNFFFTFNLHLGTVLLLLLLLLGSPGAANRPRSQPTELLVGQQAHAQLANPSTSKGGINSSSSNSHSGDMRNLSNSSSKDGSTCRVQLPAKLTASVAVRLSSECPAHSNSCTGPADALPYQELLSPCCHAHDWCYACGHTQGITGLQGRRLCDAKFRSNMIAVCEQSFSMNATDRQLCTSTADAMYTAVIAFQENRGRKLDAAAACPGDARKLAATDFCFNPSFQAAAGVVATIQPKNGGRWGAWAALAKCPEGSWASGLSTRIQPYQGLWGDDTGLEAVRMYCTDVKGQRSTAMLQSHPGTTGEWSGFSDCPAGQYIVAIRVQVEPNQGLGDDTAAGGLRALCSDGVAELYNNNSVGFGPWGEWVRCPTGSAVCGFRIKTEQAWAVDNTAMNDIQADCCSVR